MMFGAIPTLRIVPLTTPVVTLPPPGPSPTIGPAILPQPGVTQTPPTISPPIVNVTPATPSSAAPTINLPVGPTATTPTPYVEADDGSARRKRLGKFAVAGLFGMLLIGGVAWAATHSTR